MRGSRSRGLPAAVFTTCGVMSQRVTGPGGNASWSNSRLSRKACTLNWNVSPSPPACENERPSGTRLLVWLPLASVHTNVVLKLPVSSGAVTVIGTLAESMAKVASLRGAAIVNGRGSVTWLVTVPPARRSWNS